MDKKLLSSISNIVNSCSEDFFDYLNDLLKDDIKIALHAIQKETRVYIFSGLIRNYFLATEEYRDIDIVLDKEIDVNKIFEAYEIHRNSFGGFKIFFESGPLDLWFLKDTWAFKQSKQKEFDFKLEQKIPSTVFFNFSSIIYCINEKRFHFTKDFLMFLWSRELDYVKKENANYGLCIVNAFYYSQKYRLKISKRLMNLIRELDGNEVYDYKTIQIKHFGKIIFSEKLIKQKLTNIL